MNDDMKMSQLTVLEYKTLCAGLLKNIPPDHFMAAVDKLFWKNSKRLGVELTGQNIASNDDVLAIRKTYDAAHDHRIKKEKIETALLTEGVKKIIHYVITAIALLLAYFGLGIK